MAENAVEHRVHFFIGRDLGSAAVSTGGQDALSEHSVQHLLHLLGSGKFDLLPGQVQSLGPAVLAEPHHLTGPSRDLVLLDLVDPLDGLLQVLQFYGSAHSNLLI